MDGLAAFQEILPGFAFHKQKKTANAAFFVGTCAARRYLLQRMAHVQS
jgi:hypothetical protein